jgi:DNA-binding MarR family transcriptional regulator
MREYMPIGSSFNELLRECFRLNRGIVEAAQELTEGVGVTGAQWGVLSALGQGEQPRTVAETARRMGLTRQSVQRVADVLAESELVRYLPNPEDKRAKLAEVTTTGRKLLAKLEARQRNWANSILNGRSDKDIAAALALVKEIREQITEQAVD